MFLLRFIADRWEAQRRAEQAEMNERARRALEGAFMRIIDKIEPNVQQTELLKLKVMRVLLIEERRGDPVYDI